MHSATRYITRHGRRIAVQELDTGMPPKRQKKKDELFAQVPRSLAAKMAEATKAPEVSICVELVFRAWKAKGKSFTMPSKWLAENGVRRDAKCRVLRDLEAAGLIKVEWTPRKSPLITPVRWPRIPSVSR